jgi:uncharacterized protein YqhQ
LCSRSQANGELVTEEQPIHRMSEKYPIFKLPILRGLGTLGQAMTLGVKALKFSANASLDDGTAKEGQKPMEIPAWAMALNLIFSLGVFIFMYKFVPLFLASRMVQGRIAINLVDGLLRLVIFLGFPIRAFAAQRHSPGFRIPRRRT